MPKGYWIPHLDVSNPEGFQAYRNMADAAHERFGKSKLLARGGRTERPEGKLRCAQCAARVRFVRRGARVLRRAGLFPRPSTA